jgi:hypothetical protein
MPPSVLFITPENEVLQGYFSRAFYVQLLFMVIKPLFIQQTTVESNGTRVGLLWEVSSFC